MKFNLPLALEVWDQITEHPESHIQDMHFSELIQCGCIMGWAEEKLGLGKRVSLDELMEMIGVSQDTFISIYLEDNKDSAKAKFRALIDKAIEEQAQELTIEKELVSA